MKDRKKPVARRFQWIQAIELDGFCEILESLKLRNVHRISGNNSKFHLTLDQCITLAHWFKLSGTDGYFREKPNEGAYSEGATWNIDDMISGDALIIPE